MRVNITIHGLIHLAHTKNEINRKRRRFYAALKNEKSHIHPVDAAIGYAAAQRETKELTPDFSAIRKLIGAEVHWGLSGGICCIKYQGKTYNAKQFKAMSDDYMVEAKLLGFGS